MLKLGGVLIIVVLLFTACQQSTTIDLAGEWQYRLDPQSKGEKEQWYAEIDGETIFLPGALRDYGIGNKPSLTTEWTGSIYDSSWYFNPEMEKYRTGDVLKFPFWLTPETRYVGAAWYQKEVEISNNWEDKVLLLELERPHWQTKVWIDTILVGGCNSLSTPHIYRFDASRLGKGKHLLTVCVDNAIHDVDPGINSHSISDHTQGNWNGIIGEMRLSAQSKVAIERVKVVPDIAGETLNVNVFLTRNDLTHNQQLRIRVKGFADDYVSEVSKVAVEKNTNPVDISIKLGEEVELWSEFSPNLYEMEVELIDGGKVIDTQNVTFGMRQFGMEGKHFTINGIPTFLRGTTECCVFPLTGYPPTEEKEWTRIFEKCKSFGLNHMRFHSYCPPEAAFDAADKAGIYLQVEGPSWAKYSTSLGYGKPIDQYLMDETKRIIDAYGNHPSFVMMAYGNEPSGRYVGYLENWVDHFKAYDEQRLFTGASTGGSWQIIKNSDYIDRAPPRGLAWKNKQPETLFDYRDKTEGLEQPYVTFEMGQWCAFPDFKEIPEYTGPLKARNFELFQENLMDKGMSDMSEKFLMASGKLQLSCYKQEIEATLRTPNLAGFQLLSLNDFPGQGTALVGVLNAFWKEKGYVTSDEFCQFCNKVVPLARFSKYVYSNSDTLKALLEVANFSGNVLDAPVVSWQLVDTSGKIVRKGEVEKESINLGSAQKLANLELPLGFVKKATQLTLKLFVNEYSNQWKLWVYPIADSTESNDVLVVTELNERALDVLRNGGKVLLNAAEKVENGKDVVQYFIPVFWNTSWFRMRPPHTTGIYIQNEHPAFDDFPTDFYSDFHWWELVNCQQVMNLENFPSDFHPIVQPIDTWFLNRRLAMLFEAKVFGGKLMVSSVDLNEDQECPVKQQFRKSLLEYMNSEKFQPEMELEPEVITELFEVKDRPVWNAYVNDNP